MPRKKSVGGVIPPEGEVDFMTEGVPGGPPPPEPESSGRAAAPKKRGPKQKATDEQVQHLTSLVDAVPLTLMMLLGPEAAFTPLEKMLIKDSAQRYIAELDRRTVEALNTWLPVVSFLAGSTMYALRMSQLWERKQKEREMREAQQRAAEEAARRKAMGMLREPERTEAEQAPPGEEKKVEESPPVMPPPPEITQHFAPR